MQNSIFVAANSSLAQCPLSPLSPLSTCPSSLSPMITQYLAAQRCNGNGRNVGNGGNGRSSPSSSTKH